MIRSRRALTLLVALVAFAAPSGSGAQSPLTENTVRLDDGAWPAEAHIDAAAWLVGSWAGPAFGGRAEEVWLPAVGDAMLGMFRLSVEGAPEFYELFALVVEDGRMILRLKHFHPDMTGWETRDETVDFPLVTFDADTLRFHGLTLRREGSEALTIFLAMRGSDGGFREETIRYRRVGGRGEDDVDASSGSPAHRSRPLPIDRSAPRSSRDGRRSPAMLVP